MSQIEKKVAETLVKNTFERTVHRNEYKNEKHWGPAGDPLNPLIDPIMNTISDFKHAPANSLNIPFAEMSDASYHPGTTINDYIIDKNESTIDRTVYVHKSGKHAVIAFRGTDPKNWRDVTTDALMGLDQKKWSHRFWNAEQVTKRVIAKYGQKNVYATGHSLGGSQALHVSNKYGIHAEAYNPFISYGEFHFEHEFHYGVIHYNVSDPIAAGVPFIKTKKTYYHFNPKSWPGFGQHGIGNIVEQSKREIVRSTDQSIPIPQSKRKPRPTHIPKPPVVTKSDRVDIIRNVLPNERPVEVKRVEAPVKHTKYQTQINVRQKQKAEPQQVIILRKHKRKLKKLSFGLEELIYT